MILVTGDSLIGDPALQSTAGIVAHSLCPPPHLALTLVILLLLLHPFLLRREITSSYCHPIGPYSEISEFNGADPLRPH